MMSGIQRMYDAFLTLSTEERKPIIARAMSLAAMESSAALAKKINGTDKRAKGCFLAYYFVCSYGRTGELIIDDAWPYMMFFKSRREAVDWVVANASDTYGEPVFNKGGLLSERNTVNVRMSQEGYVQRTIDVGDTIFAYGLWTSDILTEQIEDGDSVLYERLGDIPSDVLYYPHNNEPIPHGGVAALSDPDLAAKVEEFISSQNLD